MKTVLIALVLLTGCGTGRRINTQSDPFDVGPGSKNPLIHASKGWNGKKVTIKLSSSAPQSLVYPIVAAVKSWNDAAEREIITYGGISPLKRSGGQYSSLDDNQTVVYSENNWGSVDGDSSTMAKTIWANNGANKKVIVASDIIMNTRDYEFVDAGVVFDSKEKQYVDAEMVLLHEIGHLLGLGHNNDEDSIMYPSAPVGLGYYQRSLSQDDRDSIQSIYK